MKILWTAPFPYEIALGDNTTLVHPSPWVIELAKEVSKQVDLTVVNWSKQVDSITEFDNEGIHFIFAKRPRLRYDLISLFRSRINHVYNYLLKKGYRYDIVHVHGTERQFEIIPQKLGIPYIISIQGIMNVLLAYYPRKYNAVYLQWLLSSWYERKAIRRSENFICRTILDKGYVKKLNPYANIFSIWELMRNDFWCDNYNSKSKSVVFIGGTNHFKGFREVLRAINYLKKTEINLKLIICGHGQEQEIEDFIQNEKLTITSQDYVFRGFQTSPQLAKIFRESFCMLHPSYMDNSPNSICEAQVSGLPVIASNVGGVGSLIEDGVTGLFVDRYDHLGIAQQLRMLLSNNDLYNAISQNSRRVARDRHDKDRIVRETLYAYKEISY